MEPRAADGFPASLRAVPNALSSLRLALAGALPLLDQGWWLSIVLVAGITDWLDGFLARRWGITSWWGGVLDGLADKFFIFSALMVLAVHDAIPGWWVPVILCRDVVVAIGTAIAVIRRNREALRNLGSRLFGKVTTILVFVLLVLLLAAPERTRLHEVLFTIAALSSLAAAADYTRVRIRGLMARPPSP